MQGKEAPLISESLPVYTTLVNISGVALYQKEGNIKDTLSKFNLNFTHHTEVDHIETCQSMKIRCP